LFRQYHIKAIFAITFQQHKQQQRTMEEVFNFLTLAAELEDKNKIEAATKVGAPCVLFVNVKYGRLSCFSKKHHSITIENSITKRYT
jgi:hypothetical protein